MNKTRNALGSRDGAFSKGACPTKGLRLNFGNVSLAAILNYLHESTGVPIEVNCDVDIERLIDLHSPDLVSKQQAVKLLKEALVGQGFTAIDKNGMLAIIRSQDVKKHCIPLPLVVFSA